MEKVQSETWVGAMTPEQILELAHEAGFPRDTIFYRSDQFITFANAIAQRTRDALKAQAGEPVAWQHRQRGLKEYEWQEWQTVGYKPQGPESQTFQMRPLFTHPTTERPYNPLNDYAVISMNPTEPVKAQAGEPDFYVRRRPSPGYEVVSSSDPMAQPAYLHSTTERRVIPEDAELLAFAADEQFFLFCEELEVLDIMRTTLQKYLNAAPAKGEV
jgi:hypothetical protein